MKKGGVVLDAWKIEIFRKHLDDAGFEYEEFPETKTGELKGTITLMVQYDWVKDLHPVIKAANAAAAEFKKNK